MGGAAAVDATGGGVDFTLDPTKLDQKSDPAVAAEDARRGEVVERQLRVAEEAAPEADAEMLARVRAQGSASHDQTTAALKPAKGAAASAAAPSFFSVAKPAGELSDPESALSDYNTRYQAKAVTLIERSTVIDRLTKARYAVANDRSRYGTATESITRQLGILRAAYVTLPENLRSMIDPKVFEVQTCLDHTTKSFWTGKEVTKTFTADTVGEADAALRGVIDHLQAVQERDNKKLDSDEKQLQQHLDQRFARTRPEFLASLNSDSPQQLYTRALDLIHAIDEQTTTRDVAKEQVGQSSSSSTFRSREDHLFSSRGTSASSSSSSVAYQLIVPASDYTVAVTPSAKVDKYHLATTSPVDARIIAEMALDVSDIVTALKRRDPDLASGLAQWADHSRITFSDTTSGNTQTVQIARARADLPALQGLGVLTPSIANALSREARSAAAHRLH